MVKKFDQVHMERFERTGLWRSTLASQNGFDSEGDNRERLRNAFFRMRDRARTLSNEIAKDLPEFTVHDISHIDALWEMADMISGEGFRLTPAESFVLGAAFLTHDLGMGLASYPLGKRALRETDQYKDHVANRLRELHGRVPTAEEIENVSENIELDAIKFMLREKHAEKAEELLDTAWIVNGTDFFLIDEPELRKTYGAIIGKIAHSHWWKIDKLGDEFLHPIGAPAGYDNSWIVDGLKIACILRVADAAHLDATRAPSFLLALRQPKGLSAEHWLFQNKLLQPRADNDRLLYTSSSAFREGDSSSWWQCYDTLQLVDQELRDVDSLLADKGRPRLALSSVSNISSPERLASVVKVEGWIPVDVKIKVGNVVKLVRELGGEKLYGTSRLVPLREMIQNASDAICARRSLEEKEDTWGKITVSIGSDEIGDWLEVSDNGIGMSENVLSSSFIDFGTSFWGTDQMAHEFPGLASSSFSPTGKFGIGFFSLFMWGTHIKVTSRKLGSARAETHVLEFSNGVFERPLLRKAKEEEFRSDEGTAVRIWITHQDVGLDMNDKEDALAAIQRLCPTMNTDIFLVQDGMEHLAVAGNEWLNMTDEEFVLRQLREELDEVNFELIVRNMRFLTDENGLCYGRACIYLGEKVGGWRQLHSGVVTVGGLNSCELSNVIGIFVGNPASASRMTAIPSVSASLLKIWATEQAELLSELNLGDEMQAEYSAIIRLFGGVTKDLKMAETSAGWVSVNELSDSVNGHNILFVQDAAVSLYRYKNGGLVLNENVVSVAMGSRTILQTGFRWSNDLNWPAVLFPNELGRSWILQRSLAGLALETILNKWGVSLSSECVSFEQGSDENIIKEIVGVDGNDAVSLSVDKLSYLQ